MKSLRIEAGGRSFASSAGIVLLIAGRRETCLIRQLANVNIHQGL
jgi:hypothetical protein